MDESSLQLATRLSTCWMKRSEQRQVPLFTGDNRWINLIGSYDWLEDQVVLQQIDAVNRYTVIDFLLYLFTEVYPDDNLVLVWDNLGSHRSHETLALLSLFEHRVRVVYLPKYAPELNLIERFWQHLKKTVCAHRLYHHMDELVQDVFDFVALQNSPDYPDRILFSKNFL